MKGLRYSFLFVLLPCLFIQPSVGQFLHFNKLNHRVYANYHVGDQITFKIRKTEQRYQGVIYDFTDSTIVFENYAFKTEEIASIYIDHKIKSHYILKYNWSRILMIMGIGYPAIEVLNSGRVDRKVVTNGIGLMGAGLIVSLFTKDQIPINEKNTLTIIHTPIRPQREPGQAIELNLN